MTRDAILVGTGGQGRNWCADYLPPIVNDGLVSVCAAVDIDPQQHANAREHLDVPEEHCYTDVETACREHDADFCIVVVPPWSHEAIVDTALAHDLDILSEKPIADSLQASVRIAAKVDAVDAKMGVTMSHRFDRDKTTLRRHLRSSSPGPIDYLVGRFTCNARSYGSWGAFRHDMADVLLIEGAVHQLDFIADMADSRCETLYCDTWLPDWAEYDGDVQALVQLRFENGVRASWEGAKANATTMNGWTSDYLRAECRDETVVLDDREITRYPYDATSERVDGSLTADRGRALPLADGDRWGNTWLVEQFVEWINGGDAMATNVRDNLQSVALMEAAIQSSHTGEPVAVQELLAETRAEIDGR